MPAVELVAGSRVFKMQYCWRAHNYGYTFFMLALSAGMLGKKNLALYRAKLVPGDSHLLSARLKQFDSRHGCRWASR